MGLLPHTNRCICTGCAGSPLPSPQVQFQYLSKALTQPFETDKRYQLVGLCGLHVMYAALYPEKAVKDSDHKKFFRQLWDLQRKVRRGSLAFLERLTLNAFCLLSSTYSPFSGGSPFGRPIRKQVECLGGV